MELIDKTGIFMERNQNFRKDYGDVEVGDVEKKIETNEFTGLEGYQTEIEDSIIFYYKIESLKNVFKKKNKAGTKQKEQKEEKPKDEEKEENNEDNIIIEEEKKDDNNKEKSPEDEEVLEEVDEDDLTNDQKMERLLKKQRIEEKKAREKALKKKIDVIKPPLCLTILDVHFFRLIKFILWILSFTLLFISYHRAANKGIVSIQEMREMSNVLNRAVLFNVVYKDVLRHPTDFLDWNTNKIINSRIETNVYFNLMFNNIFMKSPLSEDQLNKPDNDIDIYNGYFQRANSFYEVMTSMKITFKSSSPFLYEKFGKDIYLDFPLRNSSFDFFKTFTREEEITDPIKSTVYIY